jgi:DNA adenine methylase
MVMPLFKWPGGKRWLASQIAVHIKGSFERYIEPFLGGAAVLFALEPSKGITSDINPELVNCYLSVKKEARRVLNELRKLQSNRDEYYQIRDEWEPQCQFQRAARLIYLMRNSWNGLYRVNKDGKFNVPYCYRQRKDEIKDDIILKIQSILENIEFKCSDFESIISESKEGDLIFADPPYFDHNHKSFGKYNPISFNENDQDRLANALIKASTKGATWILTNGSIERVQYLFGNYNIFALPRHSIIAASSKSRKKILEYVVLSKSKVLESLHNYLSNNYERVN